MHCVNANGYGMSRYIIPWRNVLLKELIIIQLINKFPSSMKHSDNYRNE